MIKRLIREPLLHFIGLAIVIFGVYSAMNGQDFSSKPRIEVGAARIEQLAGLFARSWMRPPTAEELKGIIDDYLKEEIYYREAKALGLDADDTVIRRRLRLKMELLNEAAVDQLSPSEKDLRAFFTEHAADYKVEASTAFDQVYLSPDRRGAAIASDAAALLEALRKGTAGDPAAAGDPTILPGNVDLAAASRIARDFGDAFATAVTGLPVGVWSGPIASTFGQHLVRVREKTPERIPELPDVRDDVARDWRSAQVKQTEAQRLDKFAEHYDIIVAPLPAVKVRPAGQNP